MKRLLKVFLCLISVACFVGCNSEEKVNVDFRIDGESHLVIFDKGTVITDNVIPLEINKDEFDLYYNEDKTEIYRDEPIEKDTIIYVGIKEEEDEMIFEEVINKVKQSYVQKYLKEKRSDATVEDVWLFEFLGIYGNSFVGIILDRKNSLFPDVLVPCEIEGLNFSYSRGYPILVYNNEKFYSLGDAYVNGIITFAELNVIYNIYHKLETLK